MMMSSGDIICVAILLYDWHGSCVNLDSVYTIDRQQMYMYMYSCNIEYCLLFHNFKFLWKSLTQDKSVLRNIIHLKIRFIFQDKTSTCTL